MITLNSCPICTSSQIVKYPQMGIAPHVSYEIMPQVFVDAAIITHYSTCQNCLVIFQNPRLSDSELGKFYGEGFYRRTLNLTDEGKDKDEADRAKFDANLIKQIIGEVKSHLDVGCSRGYLLVEVGSEHMVGVENDAANVSVKGIQVYPQMDKIPNQSFNLVTAIHVLEHVPSPLEFLKNMVKFMAKNGYLVIEVPTWKSPGGPLRLAHLFHFEPDVLKLMCLQVGLEVIHMEFTPHLILICKADR